MAQDTRELNLTRRTLAPNCANDAVVRTLGYQLPARTSMLVGGAIPMH